jgi:hypothetical protein
LAIINYQLSIDNSNLRDQIFVYAAGDKIRKKTGGSLSPQAQRFAKSAQDARGKSQVFARFAQKFARNAQGRKNRSWGIVFERGKD